MHGVIHYWVEFPPVPVKGVRIPGGWVVMGKRDEEDGISCNRVFQTSDEAYWEKNRLESLTGRE